MGGPCSANWTATRTQSESIADIIESDAMSQLGMGPRNDMTPRAKLSDSLNPSRFARQLRIKNSGMKLQICRSRFSLDGAGIYGYHLFDLFVWRFSGAQENHGIVECRSLCPAG